MALSRRSPLQEALFRGLSFAGQNYLPYMEQKRAEERQTGLDQERTSQNNLAQMMMQVKYNQTQEDRRKAEEAAAAAESQANTDRWLQSIEFADKRKRNSLSDELTRLQMEVQRATLDKTKRETDSKYPSGAAAWSDIGSKKQDIPAGVSSALAKRILMASDTVMENPPPQLSQPQIDSVLSASLTGRYPQRPDPGGLSGLGGASMSGQKSMDIYKIARQRFSDFDEVSLEKQNAVIAQLKAELGLQ